LFSRASKWLNISINFHIVLRKQGVFGSTFFFATGFYKALFTYKLPITSKSHLLAESDPINMYNLKYKLYITFAETAGRLKEAAKKKNYFYLNRKLIEWFVGEGIRRSRMPSTDAECNFNINTVGLNDNTLKSVQFTFQIGLHVD